MKGGGKAVETYKNFPDFNFPASEFPCNKHPYSYHVGICPYCLKDRLIKLVCSECGKHRISSCSCSDFSSSNRNSCSTILDAGSVGRISFLVGNEKFDQQQPRNEGSEKDILFRRSSSSCVEVNKKKGFSRIARLFRGKRKTGRSENGEVCSSDIMGLSRSRSVCSFGGGKNSAFDDFTKIADASSRVFFDPDKELGFSYDQNGSCDESAFIDLKIDPLNEPKQDFFTGKFNGVLDRVYSCRNDKFGIGGNFSSCRITMDERGLKQGRKKYEVWKWIFKYNNNNNTSAKDGKRIIF